MNKPFKNIAIVGNPNCGKSSLFNALTGLHQKVGNFPGVTVDKKTGKLFFTENESVNIVDLPGTYSLYPKSDDEVVTFDVLFDDEDAVKIDAIIVVVDASNLKRNLLFCSQIMDLKKPIIVALTMMDIAKQKGIHIDIDGLSRELSTAVIAVNPRKNKGITELKKQIQYSLHTPYTPLAKNFIENDSIFHQIVNTVHQYKNTSSQYAAFHFACVFEKLPILTLQEKENLKADLTNIQFNKSKIQAEETLKRYAQIKKIMQGCVTENNPLKKELFSRKIDELLLHRVYGNIFFLLVLFILFQSVYWLAQYPMEWIDLFFGKIISSLNNTLPSNFFSDLLINGILAGINGIVVFIPQIMILFGMITILEDTGYMSRISFLSDRLMRSVGLNGKSMMPLISATACAVPAIMATRTIENKKERLITILITPLMSCSARLPVYAVLISLVIPNTFLLGFLSLQGLVMMLMYLLGFAMSIIVAYVINKLIKVKDRSIFLMELPVYKMPRWNNVLLTMYQKSTLFVKDAGKIILVISVILWALSSYGPGEKNSGKYITKTNLENSYAGITGKFIEPTIKPLGFDWKIGIALITSFAAREVFVGTMSTLYSVENDNEKTLIKKMNTATDKNGEKIYSFKNGLSLLLFYAFAMQCMSTMAIVKRETNTWKYPLIQFLFMGAIAYFSAWFVQLVF